MRWTAREKRHVVQHLLRVPHDTVSPEVLDCSWPGQIAMEAEPREACQKTVHPRDCNRFDHAKEFWNILRSPLPGCDPYADTSAADWFCYAALCSVVHGAGQTNVRSCCFSPKPGSGLAQPIPATGRMLIFVSYLPMLVRQQRGERFCCICIWCGPGRDKMGNVLALHALNL